MRARTISQPNSAACRIADTVFSGWVPDAPRWAQTVITLGID
eukprot:COSAG05_NODE_240_length_13119_cov_122.275806_12_plen_42_part_00